MDLDQDDCEGTQRTGTINSQVPVTDLVKLDKQNLLQCTNHLTDPEERWQYILSHLESLNTEITRLNEQNMNLKDGLASANGKICYLENQIEKAKQKI